MGAGVLAQYLACKVVHTGQLPFPQNPIFVLRSSSGALAQIVVLIASIAPGLPLVTLLLRPRGRFRVTAYPFCIMPPWVPVRTHVSSQSSLPGGVVVQCLSSAIVT